MPESPMFVGIDVAQAELEVALRPLPDAQTRALSGQPTRQCQLVERLTAEKNRGTRAPGAIRADMQAHRT